MNALDGGHLVGRYRILKFLGAGAMGEVYLAEDPQIDRQLAIKTVRLIGRPQEIEDRKKRLLREARAAGRLLHPNVVTLFDAGEAEGMLYLAFEFVEGTDLAQRLDAGPRLSLRQALRAVRQAAEALDYAHSLGIVHRDIKPSNILIDLAGRVKVADFGIAKMAGQSTELTMAGSVMGSPQYLSPEQIRGEDLDGRSDIFSLGVVLYEILSGKRPFDGDTITSLVYQILHKEPPPVSELRAVPPRVEELLRGMMAKSRDERVATAGVVGRELAAAEAELSDETLSAPASPVDATRVLPRRTTNSEAAMPAIPRGTVPASPETTPSVPPPMPTMAAMAAPAPVPAVPAMPVAPAATAAAPRKLPIGLLIAAVLLVMLVAVAGGGYYVWGMWKHRAAEPVSQTAQTSETAVPPLASPASTQVPVAPTPQQQQTPPAAAPPVTSTSTSQAPPPTVLKTPQPAAAPPLTPDPAPRERVPGPAASSPAAPAPAPRQPEPSREPEPEPEEQAPEQPAADQSLRSGLEVAFHVNPPDAYVLVEGRVIGQAQQWSGQRGARTYSFPGAGSYLVKIRKAGMKERRIAVEAGAGGSSVIAANLQALPAADVDASDLQAIRVRTGVFFNVRPAMAQVEVDGERVGPARRFSGGFLRPKEMLMLSTGKHRISLVMPGYERKDILVEVTETADKERERIDAVLTPGGNE
ncbi:MAG TPA: serine/threonine-protein kinase [Thermoanaerobaculia bacterium]|nr:serine/threonine-protein kinase [Thermoanaerobaculia bacterium]